MKLLVIRLVFRGLYKKLIIIETYIGMIDCYYIPLVGGGDYDRFYTICIK